MKRCPLIGRIVEHPSGCDGCDGCREAEERRQRREDEQADAGMDARRERGIFAERDRLREALERIQTMIEGAPLRSEGRKAKAFGVSTLHKSH